MSMKISVCTPYWRRQDALNTMFAIYERHYSDLSLEISVCDDGDPTPAKIPEGHTAILTRLPKKDRPRNPCIPINRAVDASSGEIIVLTNPEIEHYEPVLLEMLDLLENEDTYVIARCRRENGEWLAGPEMRMNGREPTPPGGYFHFLVMFYRTLWEKAGGFDEDYRIGQACDDNDWLWRVYEAGAQFKLTETTVVHGHLKRVSWNMPHNRSLFAKKWPSVRRNTLVERRTQEEAKRLENEGQLSGGDGDAAKNRRARVFKQGKKEDTIHRGEGSRGTGDDGMVAVSGDVKRASGEPTKSSRANGDTANREVRSPLVERIPEDSKLRQQSNRARDRQKRRRERLREERPARICDTTTVKDSTSIEERRPGLLHPEWALVIGGGVDVWDEVLAWEEIYGKEWDGVVVAANDVGSHWPRHLDHWATLHPDKYRQWEPVRQQFGFNTDYITWGRKARFAGRTVQPWAGGASGMLAVQVAQAVGCVRAIMCGVPMTQTPHFEESRVHVKGQPWKSVEGHWRAWAKHADKMQGWVKSMSGRTQELLGTPTMEWLLGEESV